LTIEENNFGENLENEWRKRRKEKISFPFEAEVSEYQEEGPFKQGDKLKVQSIEDEDDKYGVIVSGRIGRRKYNFPLVDLEPITKDEGFIKLIDDYKEWFCSREW
jgi:hypothetical protein